MYKIYKINALHLTLGHVHSVRLRTILITPTILVSRIGTTSIVSITEVHGKKFGSKRLKKGPVYKYYRDEVF